MRTHETSGRRFGSNIYKGPQRLGVVVTMTHTTISPAQNVCEVVSSTVTDEYPDRLIGEIKRYTQSGLLGESAEPPPSPYR